MAKLLIISIVAISATLISGQTLKDAAAKHGRYIGAAVAPNFFSESEYTRVLDSEFSSITPENAMKWDATEGSRGNFNYGTADRIVDHAQKHGHKMRGHTFVWHGQLPAWVSAINNRDELTKVMTAHITNEATHFKGKIYAWDVVNEIFEENGNFRQSVFYKVLGKNFVAEAFKIAHQADPNAKLYINDYNIESIGAKSNAVYNLVKELKAAGVPIHGVGFQSHFGAGHVPGDLQQNLQRFADLGVDVAITELDINASSGDFSAQAKDYKKVASVCLAVKSCVGITVWGITDKHSWIGNAHALLFDENYKPKQAYNAFREAFN